MDWKARAAAAVLGAVLCAPAFADAGAKTDRVPGADARQLIRWAFDTRDHGNLPFAVVDKKNARIHVYDAQGQLKGSSPALLGQTIGDETVPGVGQRAQTNEVAADERTTPAGRFLAKPGRNLTGEHVVWADYASAFAIHRVRPGPVKERREARLASASPRDNRVSLGCVVVPVAFYEEVVQPVLGRTHSVVYVLPETRDWKAMFIDG